MTAALASVAGLSLGAQDWPQWRGAEGEARAVGFRAPKAWPAELTRKWVVTVGEGVATPALVGDRLYVFSRQDGSEVIRCLAAGDGKELWSDPYESLGATGPAQGFSGPRSSPAVGGGKVMTLGVRGMVSVLDAGSGRVLWRKDEFRAYPNFFPSSSPMIVDGVGIAQLGGRENGAVVGYDLATGTQKWKWQGPSPSYASPALMTVGPLKVVVAQTESVVVAVNAADGSLVWKSEEAVQGGGGRGMGGRDYRAATPVVDGTRVILAGKTVKALKFEWAGGKVAVRELWTNEEKGVQFSTPTVKEGRLYGLSGNNELFCLGLEDGKTVWAATYPSVAVGAGAPRAAVDPTDPSFGIGRQAVFGQAQPGGPGRRGGPGGGRRGGGRGGGGGYGSLVDGGSVMLALTPAGQLVVFEPGTEFKVVARYQVAKGQTHAYPVVSGNRLFIKDTDSVALWTVE